ncbi:UPF0193 protein EVG1 [Xyrichtys novacula]|nr:UPF0193 protein EVG1 [Xyrichtys novacula]
MDTREQTRASGGLWNYPRSTYSKETQDLLRTMMQEAKLNNLQRKEIEKCLQNGKPLPLSSNPTSSAPPPQCKSCKPVKKLPGSQRKRSAEACRSGGSYVREQFRPGPTRDLEEEKRRLQTIFEHGKEKLTAASPPKVSARENVKEKDRIQEVLDEIEERRQFLADMTALGQARQFVHIINSEISQKVQELKLLEKELGSKTEIMLPEEREAFGSKMSDS